ncbi:MAG TPA: hypothetical protein VFD44_02230 [Hanamia sp.]|jgi:hypothetical protein|nr:hypothetical protein [Hanamia sp.]
MKNVLFVCLLFIVKSTFANVPSIDRVRSLYEKSVEDESSCKELINILSPYNEKNNPLYAGYRASAVMMMAKHVFNPFSKMSYFNKGKKLLENAINMDENNLELRFLRFNAQTHVPSFLGYDDNINEDKKFLEREFPKINDIKLKQYLAFYLEKSKYISPEKKAELQL